MALLATDVESKAARAYKLLIYYQKVKITPAFFRELNK
jgi:hypothetical protein